MSKTVHVIPVPGYYISGVPHIEHDCDGKGFHHICLPSGAFIEAPPDEGEQQDQDPADAGSVGSEEQ